MKMEITAKKDNPLYKRVEVYFTLDHNGESTPGRNAVAEAVAKERVCPRDTPRSTRARKQHSSTTGNTS